MAQYINKEALTKEIERLIELFTIPQYSCEYNDAKADGFREFLSFIDTLEVKEVDFEKELDRIWFDNKLGNYFDNDAMDFTHIRTLCKHFFELGLKVQKGK